MEAFDLTQNAQFYSLEDGDHLSDEVITECFSSIKSSLNLTDTDIVHEEINLKISLTNTDSVLSASALVFEGTRPVYFWKEGGISDRVHGFLLIITVEGHAAILRTNCGSIDEIDEMIGTRLDYDLISRIIAHDDVEFQRLGTRIMTISDKAFRSKSYEAADLKGLLAANSTGRAIPTHVRLRENTGRTRSISPATGRLVDKSNRKSLQDIAAWVYECITTFQTTPATSSSFLQSFAKRVRLSDIVDQHDVTAVLVDTITLRDLLEPINSGLFVKRQNQKRYLSTRLTERFLRSLEPVWDLRSDRRFIARPYGHQLWIRTNNNTLCIDGRVLRQVHALVDETEMTLAKLINSHGLLSVTFDDHRYMYHAKHCFEDNSATSGIQPILDMLVAHPALDNASSEKGSFSTSHTNFDADSLFGIVEGIHTNDNLVLCDDLDKEWADHICINEQGAIVAFVHSKHGDTTSSASKFHDVVGQAIKNLGNMFFTKKMLFDKWTNVFSKKYRAPGTNTKIKRVRRGDKKWANKHLADVLANPRILRQAVLCCSFASKSRMTEDFKKLKSGNAPGNVIQLYWILSSFAQAARDMNIQPVIYCRP